MSNNTQQPQQSQKQRNPSRVGAGWSNISQKDQSKYVSLEIELEGKKYKFNMYKNREKMNDNSPDYSVYIKTAPENGATAPKTAPASAPRSQATATSAPTTRPPARQAAASKPKVAEPPFEPDEPEDDGFLS